MRKTIYNCICGYHNRTKTPIKKDITTLPNNKRLSDDPIFRAVAYSLVAVGFRKCRECKQKIAIVAYTGNYYINAFAFPLNSPTGQRIQSLTNENVKR